MISKRALADKTSGIWVPLRKLIAKARGHRSAELERLRADPQAAANLELDNQEIQLPSSPSKPSPESATKIFLERWRQLIRTPGIEESAVSSAGLADKSMQSRSSNSYTPESSATTSSDQPYLDEAGQHTGAAPQLGYIPDHHMSIMSGTSEVPGLRAAGGLQYNDAHTNVATWPHLEERNTGFDSPWVWADMNSSMDTFLDVDMDAIDANIDIGGETDWYNWVDAANGAGWGGGNAG